MQTTPAPSRRRSANDGQGPLYLNKVPGLVESIHEAAQEPMEEGTRVEDLDW